MPMYEYTFGVYVEAKNEEEAQEKIQPVVKLLHELDFEGDEAVEGPITRIEVKS